MFEMVLVEHREILSGGGASGWQSWSGKLTPCGQKHESKQDAGDVGHGKCYMMYIEQVQLLRKLRFCVFFRMFAFEEFLGLQIFR